jgi:1-acyl-sn-glycerol-3-phosphate acyltransferase
MLPFYTVSTEMMKLALVSLTCWRVNGKENVPRNGPLIVVSNHLSMVDPPLLSASIPRRIVFMSKEELFRSWGRVFVRAFGAFPVHRGTLDREAIRQAMRVLNNGQVLGIFPEGGRNKSHALEKAELGAALIALRSGAPILPVGISGTENVKGPRMIFRQPRITVTIGQPFYLSENKERPTRERLVEATDVIMRRIAEVLPSHYRGIYGERLRGVADGN